MTRTTTNLGLNESYRGMNTFAVCSELMISGCLRIRYHLNIASVRYCWLLMSIFVLMCSQVISQQSDILDLMSAIEKSAPATQERFDLTMELGRTYSVFPIPRETQRASIPDQCLDWAKEAKAWASEYGTSLELARAQRLLIDCFTLSKSNKPIEFVELAEEMISTNSFASLDDKHVVYHRLLPLYQKLGVHNRYIELSDTLTALQRSLNLPETYIADGYARIGMAIYRIKNYAHAREYFKKAIDIQRRESKLFTVASLTNNVGLSYAKEGKKDSAQFYFKEAVQILKTGGTTDEGFEDPQFTEHLVNVISANEAWLNIDAGRYQEAIVAVEKELRSGELEQEFSTVIEACNKLGLIYYLKKEYNTSRRYLDQALSHIRPEVDHVLLISNWEIRAKVLLAQGRQEESEELYNKKVAFQDSINGISAQNNARVAAVLYETNQKELLLQQQELRLAQQESDIQQANQRQLIFLISALALLVLLFISYSFLRKVRLQKKEIEQQKLQIDQSLKEKELLLKEVHHRVKNNLQVVSSLLGKQGRTAHSSVIKKYMEEGQNRIQSMAIIHQQLYQNDDFTEINMSEYTRLLMMNIAEYYNDNDRKIDFNVEAPNITFHVDVAIPYGLIVNELVNNCYKYAFENQKSGVIDVRVFKLSNDMFKLTVTDDGQGLPVDIDARSESSLGLNLIKGLAWQLRGALTYYNTPIGSAFEVSFANKPGDFK